MLSQAFAESFAKDWINAWNAHDLPRILAHYAEGFRFTSPFIALVAGEPSGSLRGREAVAAYWAKALARLPDLKFELLGVYCGVDSVSIHYVSVQERRAVEVFFFDAAGKVISAAAHYSPAVGPAVGPA